MSKTLLVAAGLAAAGLVGVAAAPRLEKATGGSSAPATGAREVSSDDEGAPAGSASVRKGEDGHYWAEATVNGRHLRLVVDTGASTVALPQGEARRLGLRPERLTYDQPVVTAGGRVMAARVVLDHVSVAGVRLNDVEALVMSEGLDTPLLGMSYLGRLSRFEAAGDALILRR